MSEIDYWRLCDELTLIQAALLIAGYDPACFESNIEGRTPENQPHGYAACRQALIGAIGSNRLEGRLVYDQPEEFNCNDYAKLNAAESFVSTEGIKDWLFSKGLRTGFFFPESNNPREYLDPEHERFAPKLAAAVRAWEAAGTDESLKGTPKQRVEKWLRLNAPEYGLTQKDGKPNESAIQSIARIANWRPEGGAPETSAGSTELEPAKQPRQNNVLKLKTAAGRPAAPREEPDDEIPF